MNVEKIPINQAVGHILLHNQIDSHGRKVLKKGHRIIETDVSTLQSLGEEYVYVAILDEDDIDENEAARQLGQVVANKGIATSSATTGRVNLIAQTSGVFKVNVDALADFNDGYGITLGTLPNHSLVQPKTMLATLKIIPYSVPKAALERAKNIATKSTLIKINPFLIKQATLITTGTEYARDKVINGFTGPLGDRLTAYNTEMVSGPYIPVDEQEISKAIQDALTAGTEMILIAGETSIMDANDIVPRAIKAIGGEIAHHGVPVEPGNLLMLAYYNDTPIVGAPGCAKSRKYNVVDMVLPRLVTGERLTRRDLVELGHGGFLK